MRKKSTQVAYTMILLSPEEMMITPATREHSVERVLLFCDAIVLVCWGTIISSYLFFFAIFTIGLEIILNNRFSMVMNRKKIKMLISLNWWRNFKLKTRTAYKKVMLPFGRFIAKFGLSPNAITLLSGFFALATAVLYSFNGRVGTFQYWWLLGFGLMILTGFIDILDGSVARATGQTTKFGKVFDPVMDRFAEFCFLVGIAIGNYSFEPLESLWAPIATIPVGAWCLFSFAGMIFASYSRARGESVARMSVESVGIMERREKLALLYLGNILYFWFEVALIMAIILVGILSFITTVQRMIYIRKLLIKIGNNDNSDEIEKESKSTTINEVV